MLKGKQMMMKVMTEKKEKLDEKKKEKEKKVNVIHFLSIPMNCQQILLLKKLFFRSHFLNYQFVLQSVSKKMKEKKKMVKMMKEKYLLWNLYCSIVTPNLRHLTENWLKEVLNRCFLVRR